MNFTSLRMLVIFLLISNTFCWSVKLDSSEDKMLSEIRDRLSERIHTNTNSAVDKINGFFKRINKVKTHTSKN